MIWLSLGENCLPDDILKRNGLKSFSTPYSHSRTNIDYALALESADYEGLLEVKSLERSDAWGTPVIRSRTYNKSDNIFEASVSKGFEFTHHDVLQDVDSQASYVRKIERLKRIKGRENVTFLYHHRVSKKTDFPKLLQKLNEFASLYDSDVANCRIYVMAQLIVESASDRRLERFMTQDKVTVFRFHTERVWSGSDDDLFWARVDDDLITEMLETAASETSGCFNRLGKV